MLAYKRDFSTKWWPNSYHSEIKCEVANDSQELKDFISAQWSSNTVKKTKSDIRALQRFCASINETILRAQIDKQNLVVVNFVGTSGKAPKRWFEKSIKWHYSMYGF